MHVRVSTFTPAVLVLLSLGVVGCDDSNGAELNARLVGPSPFQSRLVSVEPATVRPEFLSGPSCRRLRPFLTRFNLFVHADRDLFLRGLRFQFDDRVGGRAHPLPIPTTVTGPAIPNSVPLALPSSAPIPIPGTLQFHGVMAPSGINGLGIVLNFDCGVPAQGTLSISVETADRNGAHDVSHVRVPVG
jgi:hypothetical protein